MCVHMDLHHGPVCNICSPATLQEMLHVLTFIDCMIMVKHLETACDVRNESDYFMMY